MSLRLKALCTIALAFSLAGCPENPVPVDAPVTPDGGDGGARDAGRDGGGMVVDGGGDGGTGPVCGNSVVDGTETCDDGNTTANDGCSATCTDETGWSCDGADPTVCTEICGDGALVGDEAGTNGCDDGGTAADDGCSATCTVEMGWACAGAPSVCTADCGDGAINGVEVCDDSNNVDNDGCSMSCQVETGWTCDTAEPTVCTSTCGDGAVAAGAETCDDGNTVDADGCSATCATESGYDCSTGTCLTVCGDMMIVGAEQCDDGNAISEACAYGLASCVICAADCTNQPGLTSVCGDGNFDTVNEMCDDGNTVTETACAYGTATCTQCEADCTATIDLTGNVCGDTVVDATNETCDDGNTTSLDGCDATCQIESVCGDTVTEGLEVCDDGNTVGDDGCEADCLTRTPGFEIEPNGTSANASPLAPGDRGRGSISPAGDVDFWTFTIPPGGNQDVRVETFDSGGVACAVIDTLADLYAVDGTTILVGDDDDGLNACSLINPAATDTAARNLPPGTYFVRIRLFNATDVGNYNLRITLTPAPICGDGVAVAGRETCDDGNATAGDGCSATCAVEPTFTCTGTPSVCTTLCGNAALDAGELCDDANRTAGDGCSSACTVETGFACSGTPSVCVTQCGNGVLNAGEGCDDGGRTAGDGCSASCATETGFTCAGAGACIRYELNCNDGVDTDGDTLIDAADPDCALPAYFPACGATESLLVFRPNQLPRTITDNASFDILFATSTTRTVARAAVLFSATHTFDADIDLSLISPTPTTFDVSSDNGGGGDNYTGTIFDTTCATAVTAGTAPFSGCFRPEATFAPLTGSTLGGTYTLRVNDDASGDVGSVTAAALVICAAP